jgi:hypothetical protein
MDGQGFDRWTRRRWGSLAGSAIAALFGWTAAEVAGKDGKKRRKRRCKRLGETCRPGGKRTCCGELACDATGIDGQLPKVCCRSLGKPCSKPRECCEGLGCCQNEDGEEVCNPLCVSDRTRKTNLASVDPADLLGRVRDLPITTWNYTADDPSVRHIGPMAQDFAALFGVGADDRHIHPLDGQGVALAAIQGLAREVERLGFEREALAARVTALEATRSDPMS